VAGFLRMREATGCDAVMIGRGAMGNPWLFEQLREICAGRPDPGPPSLEARRAVFRRHVGLIRELRPGPRTLHEVRKACAWYARGLYGCNALRIKVWEVPTVDEAVAAVEAYFAMLLDHATRGERGDAELGAAALAAGLLVDAASDATLGDGAALDA
jgi:tRNA-dihydrouridine synthase B